MNKKIEITIGTEEEGFVVKEIKSNSTANKLLMLIQKGYLK